MSLGLTDTRSIRPVSSFFDVVDVGEYMWQRIFLALHLHFVMTNLLTDYLMILLLLEAFVALPSFRPASERVNPGKIIRNK